MLFIQKKVDNMYILMTYLKNENIQFDSPLTSIVFS